MNISTRQVYTIFLNKTVDKLRYQLVLMVEFNQTVILSKKCNTVQVLRLIPHLHKMLIGRGDINNVDLKLLKKWQNSH